MPENAGEAFIKVTAVDNTQAGMDAATANLRKFQAEASKPINTTGDGGSGNIVAGYTRAKTSIKQTRDVLNTVVTAVNAIAGAANTGAAAFDLLSGNVKNVGTSLDKLNSGVSAIPGGAQLFDLADGFIGATKAAKAAEEQEERNANLDKRRKEQLAGYIKNLEQVTDATNKAADAAKAWNTEAALAGMPEQTAALERLSNEYLKLEAATNAEFEARKKAARNETEVAAIDSLQKKAIADLAASNDARIAAEQNKRTADIVKQTGDLAFQNSQANLSKQEQLINEANRQFEEAKKALSEKLGIVGITAAQRKAIEDNLKALEKARDITVQTAQVEAGKEEAENLAKALQSRKEIQALAEKDPVKLAAASATAPVENLIKTLREELTTLSEKDAEAQKQAIIEAETLRLNLREEAIAKAKALQAEADKERAETLKGLQQDIADTGAAAIQASKLASFGKSAGGFSAAEIQAASKQGFVDPIVSKQDEAIRIHRKSQLELEKINAKKGLTWQ